MEWGLYFCRRQMKDILCGDIKLLSLLVFSVFLRYKVLLFFSFFLCIFALFVLLALWCQSNYHNNIKFKSCSNHIVAMIMLPVLCMWKILKYHKCYTEFSDNCYFKGQLKLYQYSYLPCKEYVLSKCIFHVNVDILK